MQLKFFIFFAVITSAVLALLTLGAWDADAARFGGGKSFGGSPSMGRSVSPPPPAPGLNRPAPGRDAPGAAAAPARPGLLGGMGGMLGGLLAGSLIGSLLFGGGLHGGGFMDILLLGLVLYLAFKFFSRSRRPVPAEGPNPQAAYRREEPESSPLQRSGMNWEQFRDRPEGGPGAVAADAVPPGFDTEEFLRGAKMAYTRLQASWDKRDLDDIAQFATPAVTNEIRAQAESDPLPSTTEVLLINAQLLSVTEERGLQKASVYFDVLLREDPDVQATSQAREVWHFERGPNESWKLNGIQQVEG